MKYTAINGKNGKIKHITVPSGGIDTDLLSFDLKEGCIKQAKNIVYEGGRLKTRKGLLTEAESILDTSMCDGGLQYEYEVTDTKVIVSGEGYKIATVKILYSESHYFVFVFGVKPNGSVKNLGYLFFSRVDGNTFFYPESIVFYSGKPQNGGGIFALTALRNSENDEKTEYAIYEISSELNEWQRNRSYYIPTVYINGRGNAYESLAWHFAKSPEKPESRNLLNGSFYAYYNADGHSSNFTLPFTDLDNSTVICRIYYNINQYTEWIIPENETTDIRSFYGSEVTAHIDRSRGLIYFTVPAGDYEIPVSNTYTENSIRVLARKDIENGFEDIASAKCTAISGEKRLFTSGILKNKIYYTDYDNPLYFPQVLNNEIGDSSEAITRLADFNGRIIAFKQSSMYEISIKNAGDYNSISLLADNGRIFKGTDLLSIKLINSNIGCNEPNSVALSCNSLVWLGADKCVYSLDGSGKALKINNSCAVFLKSAVNAKEIYGEKSGENYLLCFGNKGVIINGENGYYYLEFPNDLQIEGVLADQNDFSLLYRYGDSKYCYLARLSGDEDILLSGRKNSAVTHILPIESNFTLKSFDFDRVNIKKHIHKIDLRLWYKDKCLLTVSDGNTEGSFNLNFPIKEENFSKIITVITDLCGMKHIDLEFEGNKGISFGGADIYYTMTNL